MKARYVIDWDDTLTEDHYPQQGPWLPGAVKAIRALERIGTVVIFSCRVAPYAFPSANRPEDDVLRDPVDVSLTLERMSAMLVEEGLGHIEIWQRGYKPPATVYIDNKAVLYDGDWDATLERVLDLIVPMAISRVESPLDSMTISGWEKRCAEEDEADRVALVRSIGESSWVDRDPGDETEHELCEDFWHTQMTRDESYFSHDDVRHPSSARFHEILQELGDLHDQKSVGYGTDEDPLANVRSSSEWGMPAWVGAMVRAGDKIKRLQAYSQKGDLPFEDIEDAFRDLAVYACIGLTLFEEEQS